MLKISHKITLAFINFTPEFLQLPLGDKSVLVNMQTEMFLFFCQKYYSQFTTLSDKHIKQQMKTFMIHFTYQEKRNESHTKEVFQGKNNNIYL